MRHVLLLLCLLWLIGCANRGQTWDRIERDGVLRVGLDPSYPPFETLTGDALVGIDIDLMRAIGTELGVEVQFDIIGFDGLYDALLTGRVDVLASALIVDETRTKEFAYTEPYFNAGQVLVSRADAPVEALASQVVAVELGAEGHVVATQHKQREPGLEIVTLTTPADVLGALLGNSAEIAIIDNVSAQLAQNSTLYIAEQPLTVDPYALVTRADDSVLLENLNEALQTIDVNAILAQGFSATTTASE